MPGELGRLLVSHCCCQYDLLPLLLFMHPGLLLGARLPRVLMRPSMPSSLMTCLRRMLSGVAVLTGYSPPHPYYPV